MISCASTCGHAGNTWPRLTPLIGNTATEAAHQHTRQCALVVVVVVVVVVVCVFWGVGKHPAWNWAISAQIDKPHAPWCFDAGPVGVGDGFLKVAELGEAE